MTSTILDSDSAVCEKKIGRIALFIILSGFLSHFITLFLYYIIITRICPYINNNNVGIPSISSSVCSVPVYSIIIYNKYKTPQRARLLEPRTWIFSSHERKEREREKREDR